ncbi:RIO1 family-domain-containing protein [Echria macrotheca]|uniref:Serine/threonine-protein kinase RIO2 n=1 Tax=Echria macrotheca TaxID=438768 RepID=A0AAJ0BK32_9PEZI|nr:RIO1 family-domain-containing protein [Echria macrotheca]
MKLDTKAMRYLTAEDWKVLAAVEQGTKNHELVPTPLIEKLSRLRGGASGVHKSISALAKTGLIGRLKEAKYDGYRLTYGGLDYLALHTHASRKHVYSVGSRIGVGKESDIMIVADDTGAQRVLKIHRLGRISFRTVKSNRDYLRKNKTGSWMYLSRLAATKEFAFMTALRDEGFPVPEPIAHSRHTIVMSLIDALPLRQISAVPDPASLYADLIGLILRLARHGLIHGDFNEFNILVKESKPDEDSNEITLTPILIDFPQMVSMDHPNAEMYFDRDVACLKTFFQRRFHFVPTQPGPFYADAKKTVGRDGARRLDAALEASGFTKKMAKDLEAAIREQQQEKLAKGEGIDEGGELSGDEEEDEDDEEDDEEGQNDQQEEQVVLVIGEEVGKSSGDNNSLIDTGRAMQKLAIGSDT